jgi:ABC-type taurine transport system ATPase subunit
VVRQGSVHAVLGPNGAGKTTAVRILATLLRADAGTARVNGFDVRTQPGKVRESIGLTGQFASVDEDLTGMQNLVMIGQLLDLSTRAARQRAAELLAWFDLTEAAGKVAKNYSGGMRRRLDLAASLVGRPQVIFLDEPTTGLLVLPAPPGPTRVMRRQVCSAFPTRATSSVRPTKLVSCARRFVRARRTARRSPRHPRAPARATAPAPRPRPPRRRAVRSAARPRRRTRPPAGTRLPTAPRPLSRPMTCGPARPGSATRSQRRRGARSPRRPRQALRCSPAARPPAPAGRSGRAAARRRQPPAPRRPEGPQVAPVSRPAQS